MSGEWSGEGATMRILHWNCQGLGNPLTIRYLEDIRNQYNSDIMFLIETKNNVKYVQNISRRLSYPHCFVLPAEGLSGGLGIFWKDEIRCDFVRPPTLHYTYIYIYEGAEVFCLTYVYGNPRRQQRSRLWRRMISMVEAGMYRSKTRLILGDLNDIRCNEEKQGGHLRTESSFALFTSMINISGFKK